MMRQKCLVMMRQKTEVFSDDETEVFSDDETEDISILKCMRYTLCPDSDKCSKAD